MIHRTDPMESVEKFRSRVNGLGPAVDSDAATEAQAVAAGRRA
jgi:hypothetical protein